jgi:hypothetical protein
MYARREEGTGTLPPNNGHAPDRNQHNCHRELAAGVDVPRRVMQSSL